MSNIPLEVSDYSLDDLVKEFGHTPVYSKVFDTKEGRTFILEFETVGLMNEFVAKFNDYEIKEGHKVTVDLYEQKSRMQKRKERRNQEGSGYGSHYREASPQSNTRPGKVNKRERKPRATLEELDAELEAYMTSGSQDSSISASIPPTTENTELTSPDITNSNSDAMQE